MRKVIGIVILAFFVVAYALWQVSNSRTFQFFGVIVPRVSTTEKVVALTFDDGPSPKVEELLPILQELDVKGTFFVIGNELEQNFNEGQKIAAAGHELGNHTYSHARMLFKTPAYIKDEIEKTDELIRKTGYQGEILFRPPNGKKLFVLPFYLMQHNRKTITWDIEPDSFPEIASDSEQMVKYVLANVKPGSIILLHPMYNARIESVKAIRGIVTGLKEQGYSFKTVSELLLYSK